MLSVAVFEQQGHARASAVCRAMAAGIVNTGDKVLRRKLVAHCGVEGDVAVFYGFVPPLPRLMEEYKAAGKPAIHIDLGYWGRLEGGRLQGFHKVAVNSRHPDAYFQKRKHSADRVNRFGLNVQPWKRKGKYILIAGMSAKHARSEGWGARAWEVNAVRQLREVTDRPIVYRPKPGDGEAQPLPGTEYAINGRIEDWMPRCHAVVTHHSNAAIDAAVLGVPSFSQAGVATAIGQTDLTRIEEPVYPDNREQWLADVAYCQWNIPEMSNGTCWRHLKDEGLVPS